MNIVSIKTHKITRTDSDILKVLDHYILTLEEKSVVAVTSKIVAICEGRIVPVEETDKQTLIEQESEYYLQAKTNKYNISFAINNGFLVAGAGIDESNGNGYYVLWPENIQLTVNQIREHLSKRFNLKHIGVIITDSRTTPLRWGVTGMAIAHSGFAMLKDYINQEDIFGRKLMYTKENVADGLASVSTLVMGEGQEQTPLAVITEIPFVEFQDRNPTDEELQATKLSMEEDLYAPFITSAPWKKGKKSNKTIFSVTKTNLE